jgi:hypothetical protein
VKIQFIEIDGTRYLLHEDSSLKTGSDTVLGKDPINTQELDGFLKCLIFDEQPI